jgi:glutamate synthase (NADPH/NADH) small chain
MNCGVPFCHSGCPLGNVIPEFNDAVYNKEWKEAFEILSTTNNFPEFTGRICPAPCEGACVLGINKPPVAIEHIEKSIIEKAYSQGWVKAEEIVNRTGKKIAIVGSGPAGMAAADQLNKAGHSITVYERAQAPGGLLRFGIPDFKLDKSVVERRIQLMESEGIVFQCGVNVGVDVKAEQLQKDFDAVILAGGSTDPRDVSIDGRDLNGVHFAMDFLSANSSKVQNLKTESHKGDKMESLWATDKNVVVIGGGDTGSDCVGTSNRHGAKSITQFEINLKPGPVRASDNPWPEYPFVLRTSTSHEEGCEREWSILTKEFVGDGKGNLKALKISEIEWFTEEDGRRTFKEIEGSERDIPCEIALLAIGFVGPDQPILKQFGVELNTRSNAKASIKDFKTSVEGVFAAGDVRRGQSLVVWAISEGRECAASVDEYLMGVTSLERKDTSMLAI